MITSMYKREHGKTIYVYGDLDNSDVAVLRNEGWKLEHREKPQGKNGIPQQGKRIKNICQ